MRTLVHPRLLDHLAPSFYPSRASIEADVPTRSPSGALTHAWQALAGLQRIPASVSPQVFSRAGESRSSELTISETTHRIGLNGLFPTITAGMRIVVHDGPHAGIYDIIRPDTDSQNLATVLETRTITPVAAVGV